jgi:hypothetical protein
VDRALSWAAVSPPAWIARVARWLTVVVVAVFAAATVFVVAVMPYRLWDSLAFGSWSRSIAETGDIWSGTSALQVSRPLFYVPQGWLWRFVTEDEWAGRLLSAVFAALLVASVWALARVLSEQRDVRAFLPPLAVGVLLSSAVLGAFAAAGMTDVPVAAMSAATAVVLWSSLPARALAPLAALAAAATVLAKPSALLALAGLALATAILRGRASVAGLAGAGAGIAVGVAYDAWQASRLDLPLVDVLRAGNDDFWLERGAAVRWDTIVAGGWLGDGARLLVLYGLAFALGRALGAGSRVALAVAAGVALAWSAAGPVAAYGDAGYPFDGSAPAIAAWLAFAAAVVAAPFAAAEDRVPRRTYVALLVWLAPIALVWASQRPDEPRLLAPAWAPFALLAAAALTTASLSLLRIRPALALAPVAVVSVVALANVVSVDGLGRDGWRSLLDLGSSRWQDRSEMENFAYGPFSYQLELARENVHENDRIVSSDGRLPYFFPGRVDVVYARTCAELEGARFFSFLASGESLELAQLQQQPTDTLGWLQCARPEVQLVGEQPGIYAAFVVGGPPARAPTEGDCHIAATPGQLLDAVFGRDLAYADASQLATRALQVGFQGARIERTGCSTFRVVVTGIPEDPAVQAEFRREVEGVGLQVEYEPASRYPEVAAGIPPVPG